MNSTSQQSSNYLKSIVDELKLKYDNEEKVLKGESVKTIVNLDRLTVLDNFFTCFLNELKKTENTDHEILKKINQKLENISNNVKNNLIDEKDINTLKNEDEIPFKKQRKLCETSKIKIYNINEIDTYLENECEIKENALFISDLKTANRSSDDKKIKEKINQLELEKKFNFLKILSKKILTNPESFLDESDDLHIGDKKFFKEKYGVSFFTPNKLLNDKIFKPPDIDFSKKKPPINQIQFNTFQSYIEPYFRNFDQKDVDFLKNGNIVSTDLDSNSDTNIKPFIIPNLGSCDSNVWVEKNPSLYSNSSMKILNNQDMDSIIPKETLSKLTDDNLENEEISCGPLTSRLLSAFLSENEIDALNDVTDVNINSDKDVSTNNNKNNTELSNTHENINYLKNLNDDEDQKHYSEVYDFSLVEERIKYELKYIGIFMNLHSSKKHNFSLENNNQFDTINSCIIDDNNWIVNKEDDEVCAEIRSLQKELKTMLIKNRKIKKKLIPILEEQIAYQEYCLILDDLDKQIEQAYIKKIKNKNRKKKVENNVLQQQATNNSIKCLIDRRKKWIESVGCIFNLEDGVKKTPDKSIFSDEENSNNIASSMSDLPN